MIPLQLDIYEEHLDEATFLWEQWERALTSPLYDLEETSEREERLLAHLDALIIGGAQVAHLLLRPALDSEEPPRLSAAFWVLLAEPASLSRTEVTELLRAAPHEMHGALQRSLELSEREDVSELLLPLLKGADGSIQALVLDVLAARGQFPASEGMEFLRHPDGRVVEAALRGMRPPTLSMAQQELPRLLASTSPGVRRAALAAGMEAGSRVAWDACRKAVDAREETGRVPLVLLALAGDERDIERLVACTAIEGLREGALWALGFSGRVEAAEACLELMAQEPLSALAGEAFSAITGLEMEGPYTVPRQEEEELPPLEEDLAQSLEPRPEDDLPIPDRDEVGAWWKTIQKQYVRGTRYLRGRPFSPEALLQELGEGPMRRRPMLALELALRSRGACLLQPRAFTFRQQAVLAQARAEQGRLSSHQYLRMVGR